MLFTQNYPSLHLPHPQQRPILQKKKKEKKHGYAILINLIVVVIEFSKFFQNMEAVGILSTLIYGCFKVNNCESWYSYYAALSF